MSPSRCLEGGTWTTRLLGMVLRSLSILAFVARGVFAHGGLSNYTVGDTWYSGCVHEQLLYLPPLHIATAAHLTRP
jgi:hypothetical protein